MTNSVDPRYRGQFLRLVGRWKKGFVYSHVAEPAVEVDDGLFLVTVDHSRHWHSRLLLLPPISTVGPQTGRRALGHSC